MPKFFFDSMKCFKFISAISLNFWLCIWTTMSNCFPPSKKKMKKISICSQLYHFSNYKREKKWEVFSNVVVHKSLIQKVYIWSLINILECRTKNSSYCNTILCSNVTYILIYFSKEKKINFSETSCLAWFKEYLII